MHEEWLNLDELMRLTEWPQRKIQRKVEAGELKARPAKTRSKNGRRGREYSLHSLPAEIQIKFRRVNSGSAELSRGSKAEDLQLTLFEANKSVTDAPRVPITAAQDEQICSRTAAIKPLIEYLQLKAKSDREAWCRKNNLVASNSDDLAEQIGTAHGVSRATIWAWYRTYKTDGANALFRQVRSDRGKSRWFSQNPKAAVYVLAKHLEEGMGARAIRRAMKRDHQLLGIQPSAVPSRDTILAFVKAQPAPLEILAREGERKFNEDCLPYLERGYTDVEPNAIWVADHMISDVRVWDDCFRRDGSALRLRLTMILDFRTRKALGYTFALEGSSWTITTAVRNAILRFGPCKTFYCDNGKDFKKVTKGATRPPRFEEEVVRVTGFLQGLGIRAQHCLRYHGQSKNVERSFRTNHQQFDAAFVTGYTTGNAYARPDATRIAECEHERLLKSGKVEESPLCPASIYIAAFQAWVEQEYNCAPHSGQGMIGRSPNEIYDDLYPLAQRPKVELEKVAHLFYERARRKVDSCTVTVDHYKYEGATAEAANTLFLRNRKFIEIAYDKNDRSVAVALDDSGHVIALLRLKQLVPQSDEARPIIAESMADRRRMQKSVMGAINLVSQTARAIGVLTERDHLEIAAGLGTPVDPNGANGALLIVPPRVIRTVSSTTTTERPQSEDIGERLADQLRRKNGTY